MSRFVPSTTKSLLTLLCVLVALDLATRWWSTPPVEATRISGRETDAAFNDLAGANQSLAQANRQLAQSIDGLTRQLYGMKLDQWVKVSGELAKANEGLAKSNEQVAQSMGGLMQSLLATDRGLPESGETGEDPEQVDITQP